MKSKFSSYYQPSDEWFADLWTTCFFVVDANVLLNLYRYSASTSEQLISILEGVRDRIWIPYQAALEYHERRLDVISSETKTYSDTIGLCRSLRENLSTSRRHPFADDAVVASTINFLHKLEDDLNKRQTRREGLLSQDPLQERIGELFAERVGDPLSSEENVKLTREGEKRYEEKIPPGYKDVNKDERRRYGDLRVWFQIIAWARASQNNVVFVTDDAKEDWWFYHNGRIMGPRPELRQEIEAKAGVSFYMYQPSQFMEHAQKYLNQQVEPETIDEIRNFSDTQLGQNIEEFEPELADRISPRYKAIRRFVSNYLVIKEVLVLYRKHDISTYTADGSPTSIPTNLLAELEPIVRRDPSVVTAIQAVHSLAPAVFEHHVRRTRITGEILNDIYITNNLPSAFMRLLAVMRDEIQEGDPTAELKMYLRERLLQEDATDGE